MLRTDKYCFHSTSVPIFCPAKPYTIFHNQVHGGMLLSEQNVFKNNRCNTPKTFHCTETPTYKQFPKHQMKIAIEALNLYNTTGFFINQKDTD